MGNGLKEAIERFKKIREKKGKYKRGNLKAYRRMRVKATANLSALPYVSNVVGSAGKRCPCKCTSWLEHWAKGAGLSARGQKCCVRGCSNMASKGAHVLVKGKRNKQHILPFCSFHNGRAITLALVLKPRKIGTAVPAYDAL